MPTYMKRAASIAVVVVVGAGAIWYLGRSPTIDPLAAGVSPVPTLAPSPTASPTRTRPPSPSPHDALGWPTTGTNPPGLYAWGDNRCSGTSPGQRTSCTYGFMHNGFGSGDVEITIGVRSAKPTEIAGHAGTYRRVGDGREGWIREEWLVEISGVTVAITLKAKEGASGAVIAEAHAIVKSIRYEPRTNALGFRLVFTIKTKTWDSG